jgi:hypothetical protein
MANGVEGLDALGALNSLKKPANAPLRRYMEKTTFTAAEMASAGFPAKATTLYDLTTDTLRQLVEQTNSKAEGLRTLRRTLLERPAAPPKPDTFPSVGFPEAATLLPKPVPTPLQPLPPTTVPGPRPTGDVRPDVLPNLLHFGTAGLVARMFDTPSGQRTLLKLMETNGPSLTPTMLGFFAAATRAVLPGGGQSTQPGGQGGSAGGGAGGP